MSIVAHLVISSICRYPPQTQGEVKDRMHDSEVVTIFQINDDIKQGILIKNLTKSIAFSEARLAKRTCLLSRKKEESSIEEAFFLSKSWL